MPVYRLPPHHAFPNPNEAEEGGLLAVGGDLDPRRVLLAYFSGIFPWFSDGQPILWWSPNPRTVLRPEQLKVPRSLAKRIRRGDYQITMDTCFPQVIHHCQNTKRPDQSGTWITDEMCESYIQLHEMGFAHSVETWNDGQLVGGLYGVSIGRFFAGESMFAHQSDASKFALVYLARQLERWEFPLIDCQMKTAHLGRFGAVDISRESFLDQLAQTVRAPGPPRPWTFDDDFQPLP